MEVLEEEDESELDILRKKAKSNTTTEMDNIINSMEQGVKGLETETNIPGTKSEGFAENKSKEEEQNDPDFDEEESKTIDMEKGDKVPNIDLEEFKKEQREFKKKYKTLLTTFSDKNTVLHDGEDVKEASDVDMSKKYKFLFKNKKINCLIIFSDRKKETQCL